MRMLDLFSGIGGFSLAADWTGCIETVAFCEIEPYCQKVLKKHWPDVPIFSDIKELKGDDVGSVDIVCGGFPCQPFSVAGKQKGKGDDRYLWPEMLRVIREIRPTWVLGENVPGIIKIAGKTVCEDLEREGYAVTVFNFEAAAVGAKHRRERIFFVGHAEHDGQFAQSKLRSNEKTGDYRRKKEQKTTGESARADRSVDVPSLQRCECGSEPDVAESNGQRLQGSQKAGNAGGCGAASIKQPTRYGGINACDATGQRLQNGIARQVGRSQQITESQRSDWWAVEPDVGRVANGIPNRVDRIKALGNSVVPQVAYQILQGIVEIERSKVNEVTTVGADG